MQQNDTFCHTNAALTNATGSVHGAQDEAYYAAVTERLFRDHYRHLYRYVRNCVACVEESEDITMRAFEKLRQALPQVTRGREKSYLFHIAHNLMIDDWRRRGRQPVTSLDALMEDESAGEAVEPRDTRKGPDRAVLDATMRQAVREVIGALPEHYRTVILLHHVQGLDIRAIADRTGVAEGTVKSRLSRGRDAVGAKLYCALRLRELWGVSLKKHNQET